MIKVGILGGTGYTGVELLRLLVAHPEVDLYVITSRAEAGEKVSDVFPSLRGHTDLTFTAPEDGWARGCDVVFSAAPNGVCMQQARALIKAGIKVIDLAADFRLKDAAVWEKWCGVPHACPELLKDAVYGLPETNREKIRNATLVANPGCYPTAVQLGLLPLLEAGAVDARHLIADAKSGISGAGRKIEQHLMYAEASETMKAYAVAGHRHLPEICQGLEQATGQSVGMTFVPHLAPMVRGIHATLYARLLDPVADVQALYERRYRAEPFVDVMPPGSHPETRSVRGANMCRLAVHRPQAGNTVVVLAVIDNLVKGAAGQAVQNFNIMVGLDETTGLGAAALVP